MSSPNGHGSSEGTPSGPARSDLPSISLIIGFVSVPAVLLSIIAGLVAGAVAVAVGRHALVQARRGATIEKRTAVAGVVLGCAGMLLAVISGVLFLVGN